jgi:AcrR family transcriptional regulator
MKRTQTRSKARAGASEQSRLQPAAVRAKPRAPRQEAAGDHVLTPLARNLRDHPKRRPTPLDAFALARRKWSRGERLDIGQIASELGVGRATLFRWVGSREQLYGEILSSAYARIRARLRRDAVGKGADLVANMTRRTLETLIADEPLRTFIAQDPEFAIRILTSKSSPVQSRTIELEAELLHELVAKSEIRPALDVDTLAYILVRIGESFLYGDVISGREPDLDAVAAAVRILVAAESPAASKKSKHG